MKNFEPEPDPEEPHLAGSAGEEAFERELLELELQLKEIPAAWQALILPGAMAGMASTAATAAGVGGVAGVATVAWLPKPLAILLILCWAATAIFWLTTPREQPDAPPVRWTPLNSPPGGGDLPLLTYQPSTLSP